MSANRGLHCRMLTSECVLLVNSKAFDRTADTHCAGKPDWPGTPIIFVKLSHCWPRMIEKPDATSLVLATIAIPIQASGRIRGRMTGYQPQPRRNAGPHRRCGSWEPWSGFGAETEARCVWWSVLWTNGTLDAVFDSLDSHFRGRPPGGGMFHRCRIDSLLD